MIVNKDSKHSTIDRSSIDALQHARSQLSESLDNLRNVLAIFHEAAPGIVGDSKKLNVPDLMATSRDLERLLLLREWKDE